VSALAAAILVRRQSDVARPSPDAWDALDAAPQDATVAWNLERPDVAAEKSAGLAPGVRERVAKQWELPASAAGLCTPDGGQSAEQSCVVQASAAPAVSAVVRS